MKGRAILVAQIIGLSLSVVLCGGCESGQKDRLALQKTIEEQQDKIDEVLRDREEIIKELLSFAYELEQCQKKLGEVERENEILKKARQFTPTELKKGLAELKAAREAAAKRLREEAAAEANEP